MTALKTSDGVVKMQDRFNGDDAKLINSIEALLDLDAQGALVPHGVGGHARTMLEAAAVRLYASKIAAPQTIDMLLFCPKCGTQHIDAPEPFTPTGRCECAGPDECEACEQNRAAYDETWQNPPHRSHLCHACGAIWRPADVPTNGVASIATKGKADTFLAASPAAPAQSGDRERALEDAAVKVESLRERISDQAIIGFDAWSAGMNALENAAGHIRSMKTEAPAQSGEPIAWRHKWTNDASNAWQYESAGPQTDKLRIGMPGILNPDSARAQWEPLYAAPQPAQIAQAGERKYTQADMERYGKCYADARDSRRAAALDDERAAISEEDAKGLEIIAGWLDKDGLIEPAAMLRRLSSARAALPQTKANDEPTPLDDRAVVDLMLKATGEEYEESDAWKLRMFADYMAAAKPERGAGHD